MTTKDKKELQSIDKELNSISIHLQRLWEKEINELGGYTNTVSERVKLYEAIDSIEDSQTNIRIVINNYPFTKIPIKKVSLKEKNKQAEINKLFDSWREVLKDTIK